jgi:hypothetical protein
MRLCEAASLALVGWYLMLPPYHGDDADAHAAMIEWKVVEQFKSDRECQAMRLKLVDRAPVLEPARCVRSDDPRLQRREIGLQ